jgi:NADH-quinone oxidoreductase subunit N
VPLTAGFLGKFLVFKVAFESHLWLLIVLGIITVGCGFYYYLKVVRAMYWQAPSGNAAAIPVSKLTFVTITVLVVLTFAVGVFPAIALGLGQ